MKTLDAIRALPHVMHVDDERGLDNGIIVTLKDGWEFKLDPGCGVRGFETATEARQGTTAKAVAQKALASA
ncbi:MAG: hypothetical protein CMI09_00480 [Oceanospirillaceae bacterium]|nr:hypothetical protein [Oceanospirillaceae bacterium]|tara:strand:+ start:93 stop:305 length:213 start_codon:yes stop_codon:yes gene_type:complete